MHRTGYGILPPDDVDDNDARQNMTSQYPDLMAMHLFQENEVNLMKTERELQMTHLSETEELAGARRSKFQDESRLVARRQALPCTDIIIPPSLWRFTFECAIPFPRK